MDINTFVKKYNHAIWFKNYKKKILKNYILKIMEYKNLNFIINETELNFITYENYEFDERKYKIKINEKYYYYNFYQKLIIFFIIINFIY